MKNILAHAEVVGSGSGSTAGDPDEQLDDYMSNRFLQVQEKPSKKRPLKSVGSQETRTISKHEIEIRSATRREEGLRTALEESNAGFKLLAKLGWARDSGLGKARQGIQEPLSVVVRTGTGGLGLKDAIPSVSLTGGQKRKEKCKRSKEEEEIAAREEEVAKQKFRNIMSAQFSGKKVAGWLSKASRSIEHLDNEAGLDRTPLWPDREDAIIGGEGGTGQEGGSVIMGELYEEWAQLSPTEQLDCCIEYLRKTFCYCLFCGVKFDGIVDMEKNCPGREAQDHDE